MSKEFERIQRSVLSSREEKLNLLKNEEFKKKQEHDIKVNKLLQEIKKNELVLEESGVRSIFEEIRDSGLVKYDSGPIIEQRAVFRRRGFFVGEEFDHYENIKIKDYEPAHIEQTNPKSHPDEVLRSDSDNRKGQVSISLIYDHYETGGEYPTSFDKRICIAAYEGKLNMVSRDGIKYHYSPIEEGKLIETIIEEIKNPQY